MGNTNSNNNDNLNNKIINEYNNMSDIDMKNNIEKIFSQKKNNFDLSEMSHQSLANFSNLHDNDSVNFFSNNSNFIPKNRRKNYFISHQNGGQPTDLNNVSRNFSSGRNRYMEYDINKIIESRNLQLNNQNNQNGGNNEQFSELDRIKNAMINNAINKQPHNNNSIQTPSNKPLNLINLLNNNSMNNNSMNNDFIDNNNINNSMYGGAVPHNDSDNDYDNDNNESNNDYNNDIDVVDNNNEILDSDDDIIDENNIDGVTESYSNFSETSNIDEKNSNIMQFYSSDSNAKDYEFQHPVMKM